MKRFLIACTIILVLTKIEFSKSRKKTIRGLKLPAIVGVWKNTIKHLDMLQKMFTDETLPKDRPIPEEMQKSFEGVRTVMKFMFVVNKQMEEELDKISKAPSNSSETSHESQQWERSLMKSIKRVYEQIASFVRNVGLKPFDQSSTEKLEEEVRKDYKVALGLTLLLPNSNNSFEERVFRALLKKVNLRI